jgi:hypothetical protein
MAMGGAAAEQEIVSLLKETMMLIYIQSVEEHVDRRGSAYLSMTVRLRIVPGGPVVRMPAKCWSGNFDRTNLPSAGFRYEARGGIQIFNGEHQFVMAGYGDRLHRGPGDLVEMPAVDQQAAYRILYCYKWQDPYLADLFSKLHDALGATFSSGRSLLDVLFEIPAGARYHHNRRAGLLQHTL